jgi:arylsulfatase A-like enzyme
LLKPAGYRSLMVGRWHMGLEIEGSHPIDAGFDEHLGIPSNFSLSRGSSHNTLYRGKKVEAKNVPFEELTKRITERAVKFIEKHKDDPFFLCVPEGVADETVAKLKEEDGNIDYRTRD